MESAGRAQPVRSGLGANLHFVTSVRRFLSFLSALFRVSPRQICEKFPSPAAAERVFSMLKAMFGDQQMETLADIIQTALMLRINKRRVG